MTVPIWGNIWRVSAVKKSTYPSCFSEDWLSVFWPITREPGFYQTWNWWWNINSNSSFHFRIFPRKTDDKIFQKIKKKQNCGGWERNLGVFCSNLVKNEFSLKRGLCQCLNIPIIYHHVKNQKTNELFLRKKLNWWMDRQTDR